MQQAFQEELRKTLLKYALTPVLFLALFGTILIVSSWYFYVIVQNERTLLLAKEALENVVHSYESHIDIFAEALDRTDPHEGLSSLAAPEIRRTLYADLYHAVNIVRDGASFYLVDTDGRILLGSHTSLPLPLQSSHAKWGVFERLQTSTQTEMEFISCTDDPSAPLHDLVIGRLLKASDANPVYLLFLVPKDYLSAILPAQNARLVLVDAYDNVILQRGTNFHTPLGKLAPRLHVANGTLIDDADETYYTTHTSLLGSYRLYALTPVRSLLTHYSIGLSVLFALVLLLVPALYASVRRESLRQLLKRNETETRTAVISEMRQLDAQFKPHFLLNTLASIKYMIHLDPASAMTMVQALSTLLRYSINNAVKIVTLEEDLTYTHSYIKILQYRYGDRLRYTEYIEDALLHQMLPKLLFQPLLENAVKYGESTDGTIDIALTVQRIDACVHITIADGGCGIESARLRALQHRLREEENDSVHTGLYNVHRRIVLLYGTAYGLSLDCPPTGGTEITLRLPYIKQEDASI